MTSQVEEMAKLSLNRMVKASKNYLRIKEGVMMVKVLMLLLILPWVLMKKMQVGMREAMVVQLLMMQALMEQAWRMQMMEQMLTKL